MDSERGEKVTHQCRDSRPEVVTNSAHYVNRLTCRVGQVPVLVALAGEDRAGITATHRDNHVRATDSIDGQHLRLLACDIDVDFAHDLDSWDRPAL